MIKGLLFLTLTSAVAFAQADAGAANAVQTGTIRGTIVDAGTGTPIPDAIVMVGTNGQSGIRTTSDSQGRYSLPNVAPGQHRVMVEKFPAGGTGFPVSMSKAVTLAAGEEIAALDFAFSMNGEISGRVVDQNKEPVPGIWVMLVAREYSLGSLRYVYAGAAMTDDQGQYTMKSVKPGRGYLLMAQKRTIKLDPISDAPADPKLRKPAFMPTYYPGAANLEGGQLLYLRSGERREGMDLRMLRSPSYCAEAVIQGVAGSQGYGFSVADRQPTSGASGDGALFITPPNGNTGPDGKLRICNLAPGEYRITGHDTVTGAPKFYGTLDFTVFDRDVRNLVVAARPTLPIRGEVVWNGEPPDPPLTEKINISLRPLTRAPWSGEETFRRAGMPEQFAFPSVLMDSYAVQINGVPKGVYVKEVTYGGQNLLMEPMRAGSTIGDGTLRVVLAREGGAVAAQVKDSDAKPVPDARVLVLPTSIASEAALATAVIAGQCDQNGTWTSNALAPGKYYVLALTKAHDNTPETIGKLWGMRTHFKEVELAAKGTAQVTLAPMSLD